MQRKPLVSLVGILSLLMGGCDSLPFFGGNSSSSPSPTPVAASSASPKSSPISPPRAASSPLSPPTATASPVSAAKAVPQAPKTGASPATPGATQSPANIAAAGLLSSSSTDEVLRNNQRGRSDPFALVAVQPLVKAPTGTAQAAAGTPGAAGAAGAGGAARNTAPAAANQRPIPSLPQIPLPPVAAFPIPPAPKAPVTTAAAGGARGNALAAGGNTPRTGASPGAAVQPFTPQLPALPEPSLARLVEVSGIVDVAGTSPKAIIKAPNENSSRYVSPGERLSDGLILVKRIEMNGPGGPVVILEQFGIEVTRRVGDRPPTTNQAGGRPT